MNLNKQQQQQWQILTSVFQAVSTIAADEQALLNTMKPQIDTFEAMLGGKAKVKIRFAPTPTIDWVDCSRDSLKVTKDANGLTMRARIEGIGIVSIVSYKDSYAHRNLALAESLETLAAGLRKLPTEIKDQSESADLSGLIGLQASEEGDDEPEGEGKPTAIPGNLTSTGAAAVAAAPAASAAAPVAEVVDAEEENLVQLFAPDGSVGEPETV